MDPLVLAAEAALRRDPAPALRLSELVDRLRLEPVGRFLDPARLRQLLELHPDRFRVLELWIGPLARRGVRAGSVDEPDPWVAVVTDPAPVGDPGEDVVRTLRESVRWLARGLDARSMGDVARWHRIAAEERDVREALRSPAA